MTTFNGHSAAVRGCLFLSPTTVVSCSEDSKTIVWNTKSGQILHTLHDHTNIVTTITSCIDHHLLATGSTDGTICIYNSDSFQVITTPSIFYLHSLVTL